MITEKSHWPTDAESANMSSLKSQLLQSLKTSDEYRYSFVEEKIQSSLAAQIRAIREQRQWDPKRFAEELGKKVSWVYRLEDPNVSPPTIPSLLEVARAYDVDLEVRFRPFSAFLNEADDLSTKSLEVASFREELPELEREATRDQRETEYQMPQTEWASAYEYAAINRYAEQTEQMAKAAGVDLGVWNSIAGGLKYSDTRFPFYRDLSGGGWSNSVGGFFQNTPIEPPTVSLQIVYRNPNLSLKWQVSKEGSHAQRKTMGIQNLDTTEIGAIA
jgi:transcriptional regulator with XRE-family HTH domain